MNKILFYSVGLLVVILFGFFALSAYVYDEKQAETATDYTDATYIIAGERVALGDVGTRYFGNEVMHDFNNDGREDVAFLITQETGGSGTFYYVVGTLNTEEGYVGSEAVFIGDRIAPQTTEVNEKGQIVVNYADRAPGESFVDQPSVGKTLVLRFDTEALQMGEVVQDFEGEAGPDGIVLLREYFIERFEAIAVERGGQPIEGFEPNMFLRVFSKLEARDFDGVEAAQGVYTFEEGALTFTQDTSVPEHSAARAITEEGMQTLLDAILENHSGSLQTEAGIDMFLNSLL